MRDKKTPNADAAESGEEALSLKPDPYFAGLGHSLDAIAWSATPAGILEYANAYFSRYVGRSLVGTRMWEWPDIVHPDDYLRLMECIKNCTGAYCRFSAEVRLRSLSGTYAPFLVRGGCVAGRDVPFTRWMGTAIRLDLPNTAHPSPDEHLLYVMGMTDTQRADLARQQASTPELSARVMAERLAKRYEFLAEASAELSSSLDVHTVLQNLCRLAVPRLADWIGVMELMPDQSLQNMIHFHRDPGLFFMSWLNAFKIPPSPDEELPFGSFRVLKTGEPELSKAMDETTLKAVCRGRDETYGRLQELGSRSIIVAPLRAHGRMFGTVSFAVGSSERNYDESDVQLALEFAHRLALAIDHSKLYDEAQKINQSKDEFLATLSHELRTPLNVTMGHADLLRGSWKTMTPEEIQASLDAIYRNSKSQVQIVDDLLNVSSMILGKMQLSLRRFSITELVQQTVENLRMMAEAKYQSVKVDARQAPSLILADVDRIQQVVSNLLTNAIKYTPSGGQIQITIESAPPNFTISVHDTGVGIDPKFLPYVFDRFRQENNSSTRSHGGLGLGLNIVRNLVELHGGNVEVRSKGKNQGSTFVVTLPIGADLQEATITEVNRQSPPISDSAMLNGIKIMLVEDDFDTRGLMRRYLERAGAQVFEAANAEEGYQALKRVLPHLLLSDISMPGEDGISFIRRVRKSSLEDIRHVPAAALTAFTRPEDRERALAAGFHAYISKPVTKASLLSTLVQLVQTHAADRRN